MNNTTDQRPIVVCVHGTESTGEMWSALRRELRGRARLVAPALAPIAESGTDVHDNVASILAQISDLNTPFHLIGYGFGAAVATYIARRCPDSVRSLVICEPSDFPASFDTDLQELDMPVRIVCGTQTTESARRVCESLLGLIDDARLVRLSGLDRAAALHQPQFVNPLLVDYVAPMPEAGAR